MGQRGAEQVRLAEKFGRKHRLSLPRLQKIVVNMGVGKALQDKNRMEQAAEQLSQITGQRAQVTKAKRAVSGFRLREGNEIGCRVTLRGQGMDDTFVTSTNSDDEARELLRAFGMPFREA